MSEHTGVHVAIVHGSLDLYGSDRALLTVIEELTKRGNTITVLVPRGGGRLVSRLRLTKAHIVQLPLLVARRDMTWAGFLQEAVRASLALWGILRVLGGADVVHVNSTNVLTPLVFGWRRPVVWHVREWFGDAARERVLARAVSRRAKVVVAVSHGTAAAFARAALPRRPVIRVVYDGLPARRPEKRWNPPPRSGPVVCCVGRINPWKGQSLLLRAAVEVIARHPETAVWLAGSPIAGQEYLEEGLHALAAELEIDAHVVFLGEVPSGEDVMQYSDVVVVPSVKPEPYGSVVLEGFRAGVPVVASAAGGPAELIDDGVTGRLFRSGDHIDLARVLVGLLDDAGARAALAAAAREKLREFSSETSVAALDAIYGEVLRASR